MTRLAIFTTLFAAACGGTTGDGSIGKSDSPTVGKALNAGVEEAAGDFGPVNPGMAIDQPCVSASGDSSDADNDTIPANATLTYDCSQMRGDLAGNLGGTQMVTDTMPNAAAWAFTANANLTTTLNGPGKTKVVGERTGTITATQGSIVGPFALQRSLDVNTVFTSESGSQTTVDESVHWTVKFQPMVTWKPGTPIVAGSLDVSGVWDVTVGSNSAHATLTTSTPLTLMPACPSRITGGTVAAIYQGGGHANTVTVTWTGCGQSVVNFMQQM